MASSIERSHGIFLFFLVRSNLYLMYMSPDLYIIVINTPGMETFLSAISGTKFCIFVADASWVLNNLSCQAKILQAQQLN